MNYESHQKIRFAHGATKLNVFTERKDRIEKKHVYTPSSAH